MRTLKVNGLVGENAWEYIIAGGALTRWVAMLRADMTHEWLEE